MYKTKLIQFYKYVLFSTIVSCCPYNIPYWISLRDICLKKKKNINIWKMLQNDSTNQNICIFQGVRCLKKFLIGGQCTIKKVIWVVNICTIFYICFSHVHFSSDKNDTIQMRTCASHCMFELARSLACRTEIACNF